MDAFNFIKSLKSIISLDKTLGRFPMLIWFFVALLSYIPCLISVLSGGDFWIAKINLGIAEFSYGAIPIFLSTAWLIFLPAFIYMTTVLAKEDADRRAKSVKYHD